MLARGVLTRIAVRCWREALLRDGYCFRLWRNVETVYTYSLIFMVNHWLNQHPKGAAFQSRNRPWESLVPPEAEETAVTKQSFAPALYCHLATLITFDGFNRGLLTIPLLVRTTIHFSGS
jgi:hypothetical protein